MSNKTEATYHGGPPYSPGVYDGIDNNEYHADPALGSTSLKTLALRTPAHYQHERANPVHKDVYDIGTLTHSLILEDDRSKVEIIDVPNKLGNKWKIPKDEAKAAGKIPVTEYEWDSIIAMRDSVMRHPLAREAFTGHRAEASVFHDDNGLMVKCRPDAWKPGQLTDLKTAADANPNEFGRVAYKFGYFMSGPHYVDVVKAVTGEDTKFVFVNVEKEPPYLVSVTELDPEALMYGREMLTRAKIIYRECVETGIWPGYQPHSIVGLPRWAAYEMDDTLGLNIETEIVIK
jgi:hypothetical protein